MSQTGLHSTDTAQNSSPASTPYDTVGGIMAYEGGEMDEEDIIVFFQHLVDTGLAWSLQGSYGRMAASLLDAGYIRPAK